MRFLSLSHPSTPILPYLSIIRVNTMNPMVARKVLAAALPFKAEELDIPVEKIAAASAAKEPKAGSLASLEPFRARHR